MASIFANFPVALAVSRAQTLHGRTRAAAFPTVSSLQERQQNRAAVIVKATGEGSESSTSLSIVESVQNVWSNSEDRVGLVGLGFAGVVALWASANLITAIDKLPIIPSILELIGIFYSAWFIYRYLLFEPSREELVQTINKSTSDILGQ